MVATLRCPRLRESEARMEPVDPKVLARHIASRFRRPWHRDYARAKLRMDPVYATAASKLGESELPLLDIGCGLGLLGCYLRESGFRGSYLGLDFDHNKITAAREIASNYDRLAFDDTRAQSLPAFSGHVALVDVLHYLEREEQQTLLREAVARVAPGACLIVRSVLRDRGWRFRMTVIEERVIHAMRWMRSPARHFPLRAEIEQPLLDAGLVVDVRPLWGNTPFNSFVLIATRVA
jgi:2-polyprenyl-3-methyl-5-hydroxy-6-metoxy-1,4-benzoquinol methylase